VTHGWAEERHGGFQAVFTLSVSEQGGYYGEVAVVPARRSRDLNITKAPRDSGGDSVLGSRLDDGIAERRILAVLRAAK
jgi:hypothetical protein